MEGAAEELRALARRIVDAAMALGPLRGALLAGSAGRGDADEWSDVDLLLYSRLHLKRVGDLVAQLALAPRDLAARLDSLLRLPPREAADALGRLAEETRALVLAELPDLELSFRFPPGTRQRPLGRSRTGLS